MKNNYIKETNISSNSRLSTVPFGTVDIINEKYFQFIN